jgi:quinol monooxygenase YgiN
VRLDDGNGVGAHSRPKEAMMIVLAGTMTMDPAQIDSYEQRVAAMLAKIRAEDGCHHYSTLVEDRATGTINVVEIWRDEAALRVHLAQPWIQDFQKRFGPHMQAFDVPIYEVASVRPLEL